MKWWLAVQAVIMLLPVRLYKDNSVDKRYLQDRATYVYMYVVFNTFPLELATNYMQ